MKPICVVFADAFAYGGYIHLEGIGVENSLYRLTPGIAYSSNLHYQIFQGKSPDDLGVFTDFAYDMKTKDLSCGKIGRFMDKTRPVNDLYRFLYRKITKKSDNIPFCERKAFVRKGKYMFMQDGECFVFGRRCAKAYEKTVDASFEKANAFLDSGEENIAVVLEELDCRGHVVGYKGKEYTEAAKEIIEKSTHLFKKFKEKYPDGYYMLISDHGMAYVNTGINITDYITRIAGAPGKDYFFFNDSVYLRFWSENEEKLANIQSAMQDCTALVFLDADTRKRFGAADLQFGNLLYRLKQGCVFDPSCFGITGHAICTGMHGYMEHTDESSGIVATNIDLGSEIDIGANEIFDHVMQRLRRV